MKKKVLLTGASGDVGREALKELLRRKADYDTRVLSLTTKRERQLVEPYRDKVEIVLGDIRNPEDVARAVDGVDAVIHLAALIPPAADRHPELARAVNVGGTRNLIAAMQAQEKKPRLIYTSSVAVYGDRLQNPDIRVGDPLNASTGDTYAMTKIESERDVQESGLEWTIFRLGAVMNPRIRIKPLMFHMPLDTPMEICRSVDVGYALVQAIACDTLWGNIYDLGGGRKCRIKARDYLQTMLSIFGLNPKAIPENAFATRNFHMGHYVDGDELESLLHFQRGGLKEHFAAVRQKTSACKRFSVKLVPTRIVRSYLAKLSEPLRAVKENNDALIRRFYGSREAFLAIPG